MQIVLASSNEHKVKEINEITAGRGIEFILPPKGFDPIEDGQTFEENSLIKARAAWELSKTWTLADDSGLCIDFLGDKPGIYSARYAETPQKRIDRVLEEMKDAKNRDAYFACAMTLINPKGEVEFAYTGKCQGAITQSPKGQNGFGYDPIFQPNGFRQTIAELSEEMKNQISHRSVALREVLNYISQNFI